MGAVGRLGLGLVVIVTLAAAFPREAPARMPRIASKPPTPPEAKAAPAASPTSVWSPLVTANTRFVLVGGTNQAARIVVEVYDARVVKGVKVARLRWSVEDGGARTPMGNSLPTQIAVSKKGAWILTDRLDDKAVEAALKRSPTFADPPRPSERDDSYVRKDGTSVCIGVGTPPSKPCPGGVCHAEYCLAPGVGLTSVSGNYTPTAGAFTAPRPNEMLAVELKTGIPECDAFLARWARCVQTQVDPDIRPQLDEALRQMAEAYRVQASTPDGAARAADMCREMAPQMDDAMRGMGCQI
jgi:hypothetical protein